MDDDECRTPPPPPLPPPPPPPFLCVDLQTFKGEGGYVM